MKHTESATGCVPQKKVFLEILQNSQENNCARDSFLVKLHAWNFIKKESLAQVFSCEFRKICKNTLFPEHHRTVVSKQIIIIIF